MFKKIIKKLSVIFQGASDSFVKHDAQYMELGHLEEERQTAEKYKKVDMFNDPCLRFGQLLSQYPDLRSCAVDIGSGAGWLSVELSKQFKKVYAIEPSEHAIKIAKELYPSNLYPNIEWMVGFSEDVLPDLKLSQPTALFTGCVLSHLRDKEVVKICSSINDMVPIGSILGFAECWGENWHQIMWHIRTQQWWQAQLSNWNLNFHGPEIQNVKGRHMGFHGVKIK